MPRAVKLPPRKFTAEQRRAVKKAYEAYVADTPFPLVADFVSRDELALQLHVSKNNMDDWREMEEVTKLLTAKAEAYLINRSLAGGPGGNTPMSIFLLKQPRFGYRDRSEQDITTGGERISFMNRVPRPSTSPPKSSGRKGITGPYR